MIQFDIVIEFEKARSQRVNAIAGVLASALKHRQPIAGERSPEVDKLMEMLDTELKLVPPWDIQ